MSRYTGAITKKERRFGLLPESPASTTPRRGGPNTRRPKRKSNYGLQLEEKQKLRYIYGIGEKQFRKYFEKAKVQDVNTGLMLLQQLERRLDNVVYRLGFAKTRPGARQMVNHGHVLVDDKKVDIPSYQVSADEVITLKGSMFENPQVVELLENSKDEKIVDWLLRKSGAGVVKSLPEQDQLRDDIDLQLIVEYYSR